MSMRLLVANRGEIAVRILRAAAAMDIDTVAVFSEDDAQSLHTRMADAARPLRGVGPAAYLDVEQIVSLARQCGCTAIHPGYGFLSENAGFARRCSEEGITFVGPHAETLELFGDKARARSLAQSCGVPILEGTTEPVTLEQAEALFASMGSGEALVIKAVAGGGGRGMRVVHRPEQLREAYTRCRSEAVQAFGNGEVYVERLMPRARHIEVQIVGDGSGAVTHLWERECSIQRRHQKLVEIAPCPTMDPALRRCLTEDAVRLARSVRYHNVGTFEFLVDACAAGGKGRYAFMEANPRLQVEHTVTEEVLGVDLVEIQLQLAQGGSLPDLGLTQQDVPVPRGHAVQVRINTETMDAEGNTRPSGGTLEAFEAPSGRGLRTDTCGYVGYRTNPRFDSLLAKLIGHSVSGRFSDAVRKTYRALCGFKIEGVRTNIPFLQNLLRHPDFTANRVHTRFVEEHMEELAASGPPAHPRLFFDHTGSRLHAGAKVDAVDPLAVLAYGRGDGQVPPSPDVPDAVWAVDRPETAALEGEVVMKAPMQGTIVSMHVRQGQSVRKGEPVLVMNAMKMEHEIGAPTGGVIRRIAVEEGDTVFEDQPLLFIEECAVDDVQDGGQALVDLDHIRPDLAEVCARQAITQDAARPESVARRRQRGQRTARENVMDLCDPGSFVEYGALVIAAQRQRRTLEDLIQRTAADGLLAGLCRVNGHWFDDQKARCIVMSYDYMVLAGTQGMQNHKKKDRMFALADRWRIPVVFFTEGGGGRPGDTDTGGVAGLDCMAFHLFGRLSGRVPLVGVNSGRCFAGNAAILGCCDVVIATKNSNIGMGGPAMIEGGGLGVFRPEEVGPMGVQVPNGVVDIAVEDEAEAVRKAKQYLSYFQGSIRQWDCADQRLLRGIIPENRLRIYEVRSVIETMADRGSVLELRPHFGLGMVTALIRIEGRPLGVVANNPKHLSGAIDSPAADKAARFMQLCDAFDIPVLFLCDTPGIMVGPEVEKTALVRHCARMFVVGANLSVPFFTVVLRKSYGLGAQAMGGGSHKATFFTVSWPTGEFGGMGLEGAVKLGFRTELAAIEDPEERKAVFEQMVAKSYEHGKAVNTASHYEIDDVIDPADTRRRIMSVLRSLPPPEPRTGKRRPCVDTW